MRVPSYCYGLIALCAASGCSHAPEAVFVDLPGILARDSGPEPEMPKLGAVPTVSIPTQQAILPYSPSVRFFDRAEGKIDVAKKLIAEDREAAKKRLARRLASIANSNVDNEKRLALEALQKQQDAYLDEVFDQLFAIFQKYADQRGPKAVRASLLRAKRTSIFSSRNRSIKAEDDRRAELRALREAINELEEDYDNEAQRLLTEAEFKLSQEQGKVQAEFEIKRVKALDQSENEASRAIDQATSHLDLDLGQNSSVTVDSVNSRTVTVTGSTPPTKPILPAQSIERVVDRAERRQLIEQQLEIWLKTKGYVLAKSRSGGADATNEFDAWRKTHRLGP